MEAKKPGLGVISKTYDQTNTAGSSDGSTTGPPSLSSSSSELQTQNAVRKVLAMAKGDGEESYSKNSGLQAYLCKIAKAFLNEGLERVTLPCKDEAVVVADLGCSSGPNTVGNIALIIDKLRLQLPRDAEFQAYFSDLPSNDFNNLFQLLSVDNRAQNFFAAGVAGSYFDRLFAQSSVHVFHSSMCLHWLSKIPDEVIDKDSPAYNSGNIWIKHSRSAVAKSYQRQAALDLKNFLLARAAELVSGGLLFFFCCGTSNSEPNEPCDTIMGKPLMEINDVWDDLVVEGVLTEHQRDTFNVPIYLRSSEDVREAIASSGSLFHVLTDELYKFEFDISQLYTTSDPIAISRKGSATVKAILNSTLEAHLGREVTEVIWQRFEKAYEKKTDLTPESLRRRVVLNVVSLIRK